MQKKTPLDRKENAHMKKIVKPVCVKWDITQDTWAYCRAITGFCLSVCIRSYWLEKNQILLEACIGENKLKPYGKELAGQKWLPGEKAMETRECDFRKTDRRQRQRIHNLPLVSWPTLLTSFWLSLPHY